MTTWEDVVPMQEKGLSHPAQAHARISNEEVDELFGDVRERRLVNGGRQQQHDEDLGIDDDMSDIDDFVIDDDGAGYTESHITNGRPQHPERSLNGGTHLLQQLLAAPQQPFQPGSTPYKESNASGTPLDGERRYLAFNMTGVIYTIFQGTHSVVNVEFHDKTRNRNFHFQDYFNYSMASLGKKGAVFAVESSKSTPAQAGDDDEDHQSNPSRIYYRPLGGLADNAEWSMRLPDGEEVMGE
jgi:chromosome transmission fidelity protein 4